MYQYFKDKETAILKAIDRVKTKLKWFAENSNNLPESVRVKWNNWHDLQYRLEDRLKDNWSNYHDWHFEQYGWNAYNL